MMRLSLLLLTAVLASAFYLVRLQYQSRLLFTALDREQSAAHKLETEREALDVMLSFSFGPPTKAGGWWM